MEKKLLPKAISTQRVILDEDESNTHYAGVKKIALFPLFFGLAVLWDLFGGKGVVNLPFILHLFFGFSTFVLILLYFQWNRLAFKTKTTTLSRKDINPIIDEIAKELEWKVNVNKKNIVKAYTYPSFFSGSWGEMITILFDGDKVMINSICNPDAQSSMSSMGRNRKHEKRFLKKIMQKEILKG